MKKNLILFVLISTSLLSCKKDDPYAGEKETLKRYIAENNITTEAKSSGLYYIETLAGTGEQAVSGKKVQVHYTGYLLDGTVFDTSLDNNQAFIFTLGYNAVIKGWEEGITYMKEGGKARLIIPSWLAYGASGQGPIKPYTTIIFDVELLYVQ